ncbi:VOC family protein [Streptomyces albidoflavus]|uniref:VOC family protein n=1 Tax=Streptomyces albidoflavus TaxID=1886 RepID=UPI00344ED062
MSTPSAGPPPLPVTTLLAVAPVTDLPRATTWYTHLLGRPADTHPMPSLAEWQLTPDTWLQLFHSPEHAGSTLINIGVPDLDSALAELAERGLEADTPQEGAGGTVRFAALHDPEGNRVTLIEARN